MHMWGASVMELIFEVTVGLSQRAVDNTVVELEE